MKYIVNFQLFGVLFLIMVIRIDVFIDCRKIIIQLTEGNSNENTTAKAIYFPKKIDLPKHFKKEKTAKKPSKFT